MTSSAPTTLVFSGPTLSPDAITAVLPQARVLPPIGHGDLFRTGPRRGDTVVILDGRYHQSAAIRHKEILHFLGEGVTVVGAASLGALRAAELDTLGMQGIGTIYHWYQTGEITDDGEVAVIESTQDNRALSLPLVNVRWALKQAEQSQDLAPQDSQLILEAAQAMHYSERSWRGLQRTVTRRHPHLEEPLTKLTDQIRQDSAAYNLKALDAMAALQHVSRTNPPSPGSAGFPRTRHFAEWQWQHTMAPPQDGSGVTLELATRYQQLYQRSFPTRWRTWVLRTITSSDASGNTLERQALTRAANQGITAGLLDPAQRNQWLTAEELTQCSQNEQTLRLLIRSYTSTNTIFDMPTHTWRHKLVHRRVRSSLQANARLAARDASASPWLISDSALQADLSRAWGVDPGDARQCRAAAHDRGFRSFEEATEAARPFCIKRSGLR